LSLARLALVTEDEISNPQVSSLVKNTEQGSLVPQSEGALIVMSFSLTPRASRAEQSRAEPSKAEEAAGTKAYPLLRRPPLFYRRELNMRPDKPPLRFTPSK